MIPNDPYRDRWLLIIIAAVVISTVVALGTYAIALSICG